MMHIVGVWGGGHAIYVIMTHSVGKLIRDSHLRLQKCGVYNKFSVCQ